MSPIRFAFAVLPFLLAGCAGRGPMARSGTLTRIVARVGSGHAREVADSADLRLALNPADADALLARGIARHKLGLDSMAKLDLDAFLDRSTDHGWARSKALLDLSQCVWSLGDEAGALRYRESARGIPATSAVRAALRWDDVSTGFDPCYRGWRSFHSPRFRFHVHPDLIRRLSDTTSVAERYERAFDSIDSFFQVGMPVPVHIFLWPSQDSIAAHLGIRAGFARADLRTIHATPAQTSGHELTHVLVGRKFPATRFPALVAEGLAVAFDQSRAPQAERARKALAEHGIDRASILDNWDLLASPKVGAARPKDGPMPLPYDVFYPLGGAFVQTLAGSGSRGEFLRFLRDPSIEQGRSIYGPRFDSTIRAVESAVAPSPRSPRPSDPVGAPTFLPLRPP